MITGMATRTSTPAAPAKPLWRRVVLVVGAILLLLVAPMVIAFLVAGAEASAAAVMAVMAAVSGSMRSGWHRAALVVPLLGVLAFATSMTGYGWGWVIVMGLVGLAAGIGLPSGFMPALIYAGMVPTLVTQATTVGHAFLIALCAVLGGTLGVLAAARLHMKPVVPGLPGWAGHEALSGLLLAGLFAIGAGIAVATGLPHGYWVTLTLIVIIPPIAQGDDTKRGRERLFGTVLGLLIVIPVSLIPLPRWAVYVIGFALLVPAFSVMRRNYVYYAFFESAAIVMLVSAGNDLVGTDAARVEASGIAVALVAIAVLGITWGVRHLSPRDVPEQAIGN